MNGTFLNGGELETELHKFWMKLKNQKLGKTGTLQCKKFKKGMKEIILNY